MKKQNLAFLAYDVDYDEDITNLLSSGIVSGFTKWDRVLGAGQKSDPKMDTPVWPGYNCLVMIILSKENEINFKKEISEFINKHNGAGIKLFILPLLEVI